MGELVWLRPGWLWALAVPIALLLLSAAPGRPPKVLAGTFALWRELGRAARGRTRRRFPTASVLASALALACAAVALAGPTFVAGEARERWTVVVDRSPSMGLPWRGAEAGAGAGRTRLAEALARLADWARSRSVPVSFEWIAADLPLAVAGDGAAPPAELERPPAVPCEPPDWSRFDRPGALWVADDAPEPRFAGAFLSGGGAVPGPVARSGGDWLVLREDGAEGLASIPAPEPSRMRLTGAAPDPRLAAFAELYAAERSLRLERAPSDGAANALHLVLHFAPGDASRESTARTGRDGWTATATSVPLGAGHPLDRTWLVDAAGAVLVRWRPGLVETGLRALDVAAEDEAPFAASFAQLLDAALLPPEGVVPLAERRGAGAPRTIEPVPTPDRTTPRVRDRTSLAAAAGALLAVLAALLRMALGR